VWRAGVGAGTPSRTNTQTAATTTHTFRTANDPTTCRGRAEQGVIADSKSCAIGRMCRKAPQAGMRDHRRANMEAGRAPRQLTGRFPASPRRPGLPGPSWRTRRVSVWSRAKGHSEGSGTNVSRDRKGRLTMRFLGLEEPALQGAPGSRHQDRRDCCDITGDPLTALSPQLRFADRGRVRRWLTVCAMVVRLDHLKPIEAGLWTSAARSAAPRMASMPRDWLFPRLCAVHHGGAWVTGAAPL
jgi:hypothetical protein